jgi:hypothetical protein
MGSITMLEVTRQIRSRDPFERFNEAIADPRLYDQYQLQRVEAREPDPLHHDPVPLFLADNEDPQYEPSPEYSYGHNAGRKPRGSRIVAGLLALSAVAAILTLLSIDSTRAVIVNAKASLASIAPVPFGGVQRENPPPAAREAAVQPASAEPAATPDTANRRVEPGALAFASPSRDEIAAAYQTAIKSRVVAVEPATRESPPPAPARRIDPDELATLLKRAKNLLAIGDITSARLLLERAADAQAEAALILAGTYDPQLLGPQDTRSITPDPATARLWYQKAAQLGSSDAKRRLSQLQN